MPENWATWALHKFLPKTIAYAPEVIIQRENQLKGLVQEGLPPPPPHPFMYKTLSEDLLQ